MANLITSRDRRISATILIIKLPFDSEIDSYTSSLASTPGSSHVNLVQLPEVKTGFDAEISMTFLVQLVAANKTCVTEAVSRLSSEKSMRIAGFVIDMFCMCMVDVGAMFALPTYLFFTSNAAFLGFICFLQQLMDEHNMDVTKFKDTEEEISFPGFRHPVQANKVVPSILHREESANAFLSNVRWFRKVNGIIVNTFDELEPRPLKFLHGDAKLPVVYPVGPVLSGTNGGGNRKGEHDEVMMWLDNQPAESVVFLCFGSMGSFCKEQVKEIAVALERTGHRFLWSLRRPPRKGTLGFPTDYPDIENILGKDFLGRTAQLGRVIGWAPQVEILSHPSVGGFVSHCGWNSALESLRSGVPMATWPMYAEQQFNAYQLVVELGVAVEITMDYRKDFGMEGNFLVESPEIERGIKELMQVDGEHRKKAKELSGLGRKALSEGGSSYSFLGDFIQRVLDNTP
ncbi:hypothetical protein MLD38_023966 [Melastoma candidum]|nr:hypothetical protein MLD38_023966 [Melastoma candidum]